MKQADMIKQAQRGYSLGIHGVIFEVIQGFTAELHGGVYIKDGVVMTRDYDKADRTLHDTKYINKGELIEFRFEYDAHMRDVDNDYFRIDPSILIVKCIPKYKIEEGTRWNNKLELKEILDGKHYKEIEYESLPL